uniref:G-patch domain and ankyrin repeats 1 n=1 Tax=Rhinopithecus bieti TaxID=61621 RepID=A0A2K6KLQ6_RHIBE
MSRPLLITFTPATDPSDLWKDGQQQPQPKEPESTLDGAAARAFYEALIGDESSVPDSQRSHTEPARERKRKKRRIMGAAAAGAVAEGVSGRYGQGRSLEAADKMTHRILRAAQEGDLAELRRLLEPHEAGGAGGNINARDAFWWTPLMCAARAGQGAAVSYLLGRGAAWVGVCELGGRDAAQLAEEAGFPEVARMVRESHGETRSLTIFFPLSSPAVYCFFSFSVVSHSLLQYCETYSKDLPHMRERVSPAATVLQGPLSFQTFHLGAYLSMPGGRANPIPTLRSAPQPPSNTIPSLDNPSCGWGGRAPRVCHAEPEGGREGGGEKDRLGSGSKTYSLNLEF